MSIKVKVRVGVEWLNTFPQFPQDPDCAQANIHYQNDVAEGFYNVMGMRGHPQIFNWGDGNAWSSDFEHPDFGGDSLNWSDDVHFCYYADHGGMFEDFSIGFATDHPNCISSSADWRLGSKRLKWLVLDACQTVLNTDPNHIWSAWNGSMQGLHILFGFIGNNGSDSSNKVRGSSFANAICGGKGLSNAWLDAAYSWTNIKDKGKQPNRAIAIAAGVTEADAVNRRENETLEWRDSSVASTVWLAWKWRGGSTTCWGRHTARPGQV